MEPWIVIKETGKGRSVVSIEMGKLTEVRNLPNYHAQAFARLTVLSAIRRFINHRQEVLRNYGGFLTPDKVASLNRLEYAWSGDTASGWHLAKIAAVVKRYQEDFYTVMPGRSSRFYQSNFRFLSDLLGWAEYTSKLDKSTY